MLYYFLRMKSARLPIYIRPLRYDLLIHPNIGEFTFKGEETIELLVEKATNQITLHSVEMEIECLAAKKITYDEDSETVRLTLREPLKIGKYKLKLKFSGILSDKLKGFYRSRYEVNGQEKYLATTQFEATDARRAFPCFDEPSHKAVFDVTIIVPPGMTAISNTIESSISEHESGYRVVKFAPTPKMSTYLLAFIVGDFEFIEGKTKRGVAVRVFTTPGKKHQAKFALETTIRCLEFYEDFFNIPYPLPVMDLIAVPDFSAGAMENWGAVTYRETAILVDSDHSAAAHIQRVAIVIAHELAHQWFGNLVTMEWWTHLWLNEGFASYMEYLAVDNLFPEWDIWTQFVYLDLGSAMSLDSLENTHPIEVPINHPREITEIFDTVSYSKGASVIRMIADYLGQDNFRKGLESYLKTHKYGNAKTEDLWKALEKVSKKPVGRIMKNWTSKPGYPVIQVEGSKLIQSRFFSSKVSKEASKDKTVWMIPLSLTRENGVKNQLLIDKKTTTAKFDGDGWIKLNEHQTTMVRVQYSAELLKRLEKGVESLGAADRLGIISDAFSLARSGEGSAAEALEVLKGYKNEQDYTVWLEIASRLKELENLISDENFSAEFRVFAKDLFSSIAAKVGWQKVKGEKHTTVMLRALALNSFGGFGDEAVIKQAKKLFAALVKGETIEPDLRSVVYNLTAENGDLKEHAALLKLYKSAHLQEEKQRISRALSSFRQIELLEKTLDFSLTKDVRSQDSATFIGLTAMNPHGKKLAWEFIKKNWQEIFKRYQGEFMLARLIQTSSGLTSSKDAKDIKNFFAKHPTPEAAKSIAQTLEAIYSNDEWLKRDGAKIRTFLARQS